jgi:PAS domain S-box-containing protein
MQAREGTGRPLAERIVGEAPDAIIVADTEGRIVLWNAGAERLFGHPAAQAVGQGLDLIIPEPFRARHWAGYRHVMQAGATQYGAQLLRVPALHADGRRISVAFTVGLLRDPGGTVEGIFAILRDDTERWQTERQLRQRLAALEGPPSSGSS